MHDPHDGSSRPDGPSRTCLRGRSSRRVNSSHCSHRGIKAIPCGLFMPTMIGVICPLPSLTVPTRLMMEESFGAAGSVELVTHRHEQQEYTPVAMPAIVSHPCADD